jgi:hypothetical protein
MPAKAAFSSRFAVSKFGEKAMLNIGTALRDSIRSRISSGLTVADVPASALSRGYMRVKLRAGKAPIRDWRFSGITLGAMTVMDVSSDRAVIWFNNPVAIQRAAVQNARQLQFGISPRDSAALDVAVAVEVPSLITVVAA